MKNKTYSNAEYIVAHSNCVRTNYDCRSCIAEFKHLGDLCDKVVKDIQEAKKMKKKV